MRKNTSWYGNSSEERQLAEGASKAMNKYNTDLAKVLGVSVPQIGTPSENKYELLKIVEHRLTSLGP